MMMPWSLYFFRIKCVAVLITVSSVESLFDTKPETSRRVLPSRMTMKSYAPLIRYMEVTSGYW